MGGRTGHPDAREAVDATVPPKGIVRDYVETILICVIFVIFSRAFVFQQSKIPSGSMEDTLLIGDYIMVNRYLFSPAPSALEKAILPVREVRRGDIIVFKYPLEPEVDYIKRVVGLPGETVEIRDGRVYIDGNPLDEPYVPDKYRERQFYPPTRVEPGHYFTMGDHRDRSADSRVWGLVPHDMIKGRALLVWWSYDETAADNQLQGMDQLRAILGKVAHFFTRSRWSRCFTLIR